MITIVEPDTKAVEQERSGLVTAATAIQVRNVDEHKSALDLLVRLTTAKRKAQELFAESKAAANKAHKAICALEKKLVDPFEQAIEIVSRQKIAPFEIEQKRKAEEEAKRLAEIARQQEEDRLLADAIEAEQKGNKAEAEAILTEKPMVPVVSVAPQVASVDGISSRTNWKAEVTDKLKLIQYVASHPEWVDLLDVNTPAVNGLARSQKEALAIPGVKAVAEQVRSVRVSA